MHKLIVIAFLNWPQQKAIIDWEKLNVKKISK